ncbi:hypothetical protein [Trinickia dinghuensis]|uniref:DUF4410 domain-containing protein n=1 Tax=Trinickia dinghuensis TaxID=2291023 RepID=A0A3D8K3G9_9BURK|nr:hypothetical protein [Trinickia dinghuensis]RDU99983.1 hypothetical protein DWV00_06245 [Trinickia dinghuensis]
MQNLGRTIAAFMIWAAAAAAFAQTAPQSAMDYSTAGDPAAGPPVAADPAAGAPVPEGSVTGDQPADTPRAVAPMIVTQVTVTPTTSTTPAPMPSPPVAPVRTGPPPMVDVPEAVYVTDFIAVPAGAPPSGLLARMRAALHAHAAGRDAGLVAQAVVQRLNHAGLAARYLAPGEPPPVQGWLIGGVFHVQGEPSAAAASGAASANEVLGADVSVTVADLGHSADTPFAVIGAPPAAPDGQSQWHPYLLPAKLSFEHADRNAAVAALAQQIADTFAGNMLVLRRADARAISP